MDRYKQVARVLDAVENRRVGLKTAVFSGGGGNKRAIYALAAETLRHRAVLDDALFQAGFWKQHAELGRSMVLVQAFDLLFGRGIKGGGKIKRALKGSEDALRTQLGVIAQGRGLQSAADLVKRGDPPPRWVRINLLRASSRTKLAALVKALAKAAGPPPPGDAAAGAGDEIDRLDPDRAVEGAAPSRLEARDGACAKDVHVPWLLRLPPGTDLHDHPAVRRGEVVLQDKSSCLPAHVLLGDVAVTPVEWADAPGAGADGAGPPTWAPSDAPPLPPGPFDVVDACAAPGNKTCHAAMLLPPGSGRVIAFDKSDRRAALMRDRMAQMGAHAVSVRCGDFLEVDAGAPELARARCALVDPSCSGSGMLRVDHLADADAETARASGRVPARDADRVAQLSAFQERAVWQALQLPAVERVAYSTCSVYAEENEEVVARVLRRCREAPEGSRLRRFRLATALPGWPRRGKEGAGLSVDDARRVVRCSGTGEDRTGGFFVALFVRDCDGEFGLSAGANAAAASETGERPEEEKEGADPAARQRRNAKKRQRKKERVAAAKRARGAST